MGTNKGARTSKFLSLILRHDPGAAGITLDAQGWADIEHLLNGMSKAGHSISHNDLFDIVEQDSKGRYSLSEDQRRIRANQGHSIKVDLGLVAVQPPDVLYHGTASRFLDSILRDGLTPQTRQHVHLSDDQATATTVGARHGKVVVLVIAAKTMYNDGLKFYRSENGVWLTDAVPERYISATIT